MKPFSLLTAAGMVLAAGCATQPSSPNQALETARASYLAAVHDSHVQRAAQLELARAEERLGQAESAWKSGADAADVNHLAYLANQQALIAQERGKLAQAQLVVETASAERNRVMLESRNQQLAMEREALARAQDRARAAAGVAAVQAERAAELEKELEELSARQTPIGMVVTLGDVLFDVGEATTKPGAERSLDQLAEFLKKHQERKVRVEGFTDATGPADMNQELSRARAREVRRELLNRGIDPDRVQAVGYGESFPVATNDTAAGRQQNRRVEIVISDEAGNVSKR